MNILSEVTQLFAQTAFTAAIYTQHHQKIQVSTILQMHANNVAKKHKHHTASFTILGEMLTNIHCRHSGNENKTKSYTYNKLKWVVHIKSMHRKAKVMATGSFLGRRSNFHDEKLKILLGGGII